MNNGMGPLKTTRERVFQAVAFEVVAIAITTPLFAWLMNQRMFNMGVVTVANCFLALGWNVVFNSCFDRLRLRQGWEQSVWLRISHAVLFEGGLVVVSVPLIAWWLGLSLVEALCMDLCVLLFFLPYTYVFHLVYDQVRARMQPNLDINPS